MLQNLCEIVKDVDTTDLKLFKNFTESLSKKIFVINTSMHHRSNSSCKRSFRDFPFMKWLEPYIKPRKTVSNFKNVCTEQEFDEDTKEKSRPMTPGSETESEPGSNLSCISRYCGELECSRCHLSGSF